MRRIPSKLGKVVFTTPVLKKVEQCISMSFRHSSHCPNHCIGHSKIINQQAFQETPIIQSGDYEWHILGEEDEETRTTYFINVNSQAVKQSMMRLSRKLVDLMRKNDSHTEPRILNRFLVDAVKQGRSLSELEYFYLHSTYSPCNLCNEILKLFVEIFDVEILVTYSFLNYMKNGKGKREYQLHSQAHKVSFARYLTGWSHGNKRQVKRELTCLTYRRSTK